MKKPDGFWIRLRSSVVLAAALVPGYFLLNSWPARIFITVFALIASRELTQIALNISSRIPKYPPRLHTNPHPLPITAAFITVVGAVTVLFSSQPQLGLILISTFGYDIFAYCIGRLFGKKIFKKSPFSKISQKKSLEGFIAGVLASIALCQLFLALSGCTQLFRFLPINILMALAAATGDIICSLLKRHAQLDDSDIQFVIILYPSHAGIIIDTSKLIPGHGGVLDRFLSLFTSSTVLYLLSIFSPTLSSLI